MSGPVLFGTVIGGPMLPQIPDTPCPEVFRYDVTAEPAIMVTGLVTITRPPIATIFYLFIHLQLKAVLPSKYVGIVELVDRYANLSDTLQYRVRFPLVRPLPTLRFISLNSQIICSGPPAMGPVLTDIRLEHTLNTLAFSNRMLDSPVYNIDPGGECGRGVAANPLVVGGVPMHRGQWPWLAAIFVVKSIGLEFHCSGTIISPRYVITVGHCMQHDDASIMKPSEVVVYLGKYNLQHWEEPHSVIKEIQEIHLHPDFDPHKYTADIALLRFKIPTKYNMFIQPVCLWSNSTELEPIVGHIGTVVGWGRDDIDDKMSPTPRSLEIPIVSTEECVKSHSEFLFLTSSTTLCAGLRNGKGPCNGDSGGGLILPVTSNKTTRWQLRGMVSLSLLNTTTQSCDLNQFVVFTDTAKFSSWIASIVNV